MGTPAAVVVNLLGVVGAVHEVVEVGDTAGGHDRQRNGGLAVVNVGAGQQAADRDVAVGDIDMQPVAAPELLVALGVLAVADGAGARQVGEHRLEAHARLSLQPAGGLLDDLVLARPAASPALLRLPRLGRWRRPLARQDRRAIARDVADQAAAQPRPPSRAGTSAACARSGNAPAANSAKARLNVASLGT